MMEEKFFMSNNIALGHRVNPWRKTIKRFFGAMTSPNISVKKPKKEKKGLDKFLGMWYNARVLKSICGVSSAG